MAISGGYVYAAGNFTNAGGVTVTNIARWDGSSWSALGSGLDNQALAMAVNGSDVYVGGNFIKAGGVTANYIAKWNGSTWSALGTGLNGSVSAISVGSDGIYVGGTFTTAGGATANQVARWRDGAAWHSLGNGTTNGVGGTVSAILPVSPTEVYVGGTFTTAGVVAANRIARFDGTSWSALGSGMSGVISASLPRPSMPWRMTERICMRRARSPTPGEPWCPALRDGTGHPGRVWAAVWRGWA